MTKQAQILIADDDPKVLLILRATLERIRKECRIVAVRDGTEALQELQNQHFDLIVTDVRMPGIDGIELVEKVRDLDLDTKVIWITAYGCRRLQRERERLAVHCCLDKPLRISGIRQAALEALETTA